MENDRVNNEIMKVISIPELYTENMIITVLKPENYKLLQRYESNNRKHLAMWEPKRSEDYYSTEETRERVKNNYNNFILGNSVPFVALNKEQDEILCLCTFSNITYGVFQACYLGFSVSENKQGKGLMFEMLEESINYIFNERRLHRIMANYIPNNKRSERLLNKLGFQKEGLAKSYLKIAGEWQDHILTSKIKGVGDA